jgi:hypothetical protein
MAKRTKISASSDEWKSIKQEDRKREKQKNATRSATRKQKMSEKRTFLS